MTFILEIFKGKTFVKKYTLSNGQKIVFGREKKAGIETLEDNSISREHLCIFAEHNRLFIKDLKSSNGTWADSLRLEAQKKYALEDKMIIYLGNSHQIKVKKEKNDPNYEETIIIKNNKNKEKKENKIWQYFLPLIPIIIKILYDYFSK